MIFRDLSYKNRNHNATTKQMEKLTLTHWRMQLNAVWLIQLVVKESLGYRWCNLRNWGDETKKRFREKGFIPGLIIFSKKKVQNVPQEIKTIWQTFLIFWTNSKIKDMTVTKPRTIGGIAFWPLTTKTLLVNIIIFANEFWIRLKAKDDCRI